MSVFDLSPFYFIPALVFWFALVSMFVIFVARAVQEIWCRLFEADSRYVYNDETGELAVIEGNEIKKIGSIK